MSLRWDAPLLAALSHELATRLAGARLLAVHPEFEARRLALHFREATLVVQLHPNEAGMLLLEPREPPADARRLAARLRAVTAPPDDRIMMFSFLRVRGRPAQVDLVLEWMTNQYNAVLTEGEERTVRLLFRTREGERPVRQGHPYTLPERSARLGLDEPVALERWCATLEAVEPRRRRGALLSTFAWTSPINAPALLGAAASDEAGPAATRAALEAGWHVWARLAAVARAEAPARPVLLEFDRGPQPYPLPLPGVRTDDAEAGTGLLELLRDAREREGQTDASVALLPSELLQRLERHVDSARGRLARIEHEATELPDPDALQQTGDLLLARFADVPQGASEATLPAFDGTPVVVELDPRRSPSDNARDYYDRAARARRARERLPALRDAAYADWQRAHELLERARAGEASPDEVAARLPETRAVRGPVDAAPTLPYRLYRSSGGLEIRVGRGSKRNDDLTFRHSAPDDIWLHARHTAGAHVILRWGGEGNPPQRDLHEAGVLAALNSKARTSGSVPVDWTRRKYVRKPRKAPAGAVIPDRVKTVFVTPDPALEERLRAD